MATALLVFASAPACKRTPTATAPDRHDEPKATEPATSPDVEPAAQPVTAQPPQVKAGIALEQMQLAIRDFRTAMGEIPVGTNAEITRALLGDNLKQIKLPIPTGSKLNRDGELCDPWGTPYFFHQLSHEEMEIHSAGPDRVMFTTDDLELK